METKKEEASAVVEQNETSDTGLRDKRGLLKGVEYKFTEDGFVDWRAMIPPEFLYPNREWFESRDMPVPKDVEGLQDNQLLVKLGGIKHVARLRGYDMVDYEWGPHSTTEHVAVKCTIGFIPNFETSQDGSWNCGLVHFSSLANASLANMSDFVAKFPESIAENRAFVRCVRNFLNINIVGDDEIDKNKGEAVKFKGSDPDKSQLPNQILERVVTDKLGLKSFKAFKDYLRDLYSKKEWKPTVDVKDVAKWSNFGDIPKPEVRNILGTINQ